TPAAGAPAPRNPTYRASGCRGTRGPACTAGWPRGPRGQSRTARRSRNRPRCAGAARPRGATAPRRRRSGSGFSCARPARGSGGYRLRLRRGLWAGRGGLERQRHLDPQPRLAAEHREAVVLAVEHREPLAGVGETDAAALARRRALPQAWPVIDHRQLEQPLADAAFDPDQFYLLARRHRILQRVLVQRL